MDRRTFVSSSLAFSLAANKALAQGYPNRPVTMIVPFAAGGNTDVVARIVAEHMSRTLGQQIVIENMAGAGGTTGSARAAKAAPDGYTVLMGQMGTHAAAVGIYDQLAYDPLTGFDPIGQVSDTPIVIIARREFPAKNLQDLIALLKREPSKFNFAHGGNGSISHSTGLLFTSMIGVKANFIPYRGSGPALNDLIGSQVDLMTDQIVHTSAQIKAGTIKAYAIATPRRADILPELPTTTEAGLAAFQASGWNALYAPKGMSAAIRERLTKALNEALDDVATRKRLEELGADPVDGPARGPEALARFNRSEVEKWTPVLKAAGVKG
jgi:tripartite-type tricarboxylate transporter receptor subunit TctC